MAKASGWLAVKKVRKQSGLDRAFVLSDHADWPGLIQSIKATGAQKVILNHGFTGQLGGYLKGLGIEVEVVR
jgi:putative mRNA 3-end processing factor